MPPSSTDTLTAAGRGARLFAALGAAAALPAFTAGLEQGGEQAVRISLALLGAFVVAGAVAGSIHSLSSALRGRRWSGIATSWALAAGAPMLMLWLFARGALGAIRLSGGDARRAMLLTGWPAVGFLALAALLFGMLMAEAATTDGDAPLLVRPNEDLSRGSILVWMAILLVGWSTFVVLASNQRLEEPTTPVDARRILDDAQEEARVRTNDPQSQIVLGRSLLLLGRYAESQQALEHAVRLEPQNQYTLNALGWVLNQRHRYTDAIEPLQAALRIDPSFGEAYHNLGWANLNRGHLRSAEVSYREAVRLKPRDPAAASEYGLLLYRRGKLAIALQHLLRASKLDPANAFHHSAAAGLLRIHRRFGEASAHLREAVRLDPRWDSGWGELGEMEYLAGNALAADSAFQEARRRDSTYFRDRPLQMAMWRSARRGRVGEVQVTRFYGPAFRVPDTAVVEIP